MFYSTNFLFWNLGKKKKTVNRSKLHDNFCKYNTSHPFHGNEKGDYMYECYHLSITPVVFFFGTTLVTHSWPSFFSCMPCSSSHNLLTKVFHIFLILRLRLFWNADVVPDKIFYMTLLYNFFTFCLVKCEYTSICKAKFSSYSFLHNVRFKYKDYSIFNTRIRVYPKYLYKRSLRFRWFFFLSLKKNVRVSSASIQFMQIRNFILLHIIYQ